MTRRVLVSAICLCAVILAGGPQARTQTPKSGRALVEAYVSAWNRHDFAAFDKLLAADAVHEDLAEGFRGQGPGQIKDFMREVIKSQPDFHWQITSTIEAGPNVAAEWTWTATYTGDSPNGPVVRQKISGRGASIVAIENGRIKHLTDYYDNASFFPKPPAAGK